MVEAQSKEGIWFVVLAPGAFFTYLVASIAETNRAPFDLPEAESELVAGYMTEFSGFRWSLYFLAEYTNMIVVASVATTLFLGGWLRPFANVRWMSFLDYLPPVLMIGIAGYCALRMPKQPTRVQQVFMLAVAGLCLVVALVLAAPVLLPFVKPSLKEAVAPFYAGIHGGFWFIINVIVVGVALIVGSYFNLQGWALLLATTPAAIVALVAALAILSIGQKNQARQEGTAATDFYAG